MRKSSGDAEDMRKLVEDQEGVGRGQEGPEEVGKAVGEGGRSGRTWESNGTLQVLDKDYLDVRVHIKSISPNSESTNNPSHIRIR